MHQRADIAGTTSLFATFRLGRTAYALDAASVQEVIRFRPPTPIRHAPPAVLGVINLRGRIVTLLDLSLILGIASNQPQPENRIFILDNRGEFVGLLVAEAGEVMDGDAAEHAPLPANVPAAQARYLRGVCRTGGRVIALLNTAEVLASGRT